MLCPRVTRNSDFVVGVRLFCRVVMSRYFTRSRGRHDIESEKEGGQREPEKNPHYFDQRLACSNVVGNYFQKENFVSKSRCQPLGSISFIILCQTF